MDDTKRRAAAPFRNLLGALMAKESVPRLSELDAVASLRDIPTAGLARGQVGTVVDLQDEAALVEFSAEDGSAYAIVPCAPADLLILHYQPEAAH